MEQATPADGEKKKAPKKWHVVIVQIPGWPSQEPDRKLVWSIRPTAMKAAREMKRLARRMTEYVWSIEIMTAIDARALKKKPFSVRAYRKSLEEAEAAAFAARAGMDLAGMDVPKEKPKRRRRTAGS